MGTLHGRFGRQEASSPHDLSDLGSLCRAPGTMAARVHCCWSVNSPCWPVSPAALGIFPTSASPSGAINEHFLCGSWAYSPSDSCWVSFFYFSKSGARRVCSSMTKGSSFSSRSPAPSKLEAWRSQEADAGSGCSCRFHPVCPFSPLLHVCLSPPSARPADFRPSTRWRSDGLIETVWPAITIA